MEALSSLSLPGGSPSGGGAEGNVAKKPDSLQDIGKNEFLKLLVAQLQHQDPLSPLRNEEFVAQLATFSSLEQLISINQAVSKLAASGKDSKDETGRGVLNP